MIKLSRPILIKLFLWLVVYPAIPFIIGTVSIIAYANWPRSFSDFQLPNISPSTQQVTFIVHGKDDNAETWATDMQTILRAQSNPSTEVFTLGWSPYSDNFLRCSVDGRSIGKRLGKQLVTQTHVKRVHLIGHSAGAFVVYGFCQGVKHANPSIPIHTSYLDPLGIYGGLNWDYGLNHFGDCADFSEAYIDIDSGVPGSNEPLPHTHTIDVTGLRIARSFTQSPHIWPVYYYQSLLRDRTAPQWFTMPSTAERYPPGALTVLK